MAQAIEPRPIRSGKSRDPRKVAEVLDELRRDCNVHAPAGLHGVRLPDGFSVVWTEVDVDVRPAKSGGEVYSVSGGMTLSSSAIERLTVAAGITWDTSRSGRVDAGNHPYVCNYVAVGSYMGPDGMPVAVSGTNQTDLRDGMPGAEKFRYDNGEMNVKMLAGQRQFILSISESKARARAYRKAFGMRALNLEDVKRPWIVFRVQLTGETDDPRTQRQFEGAIFQAALLARASLYGPPATGPAAFTQGAHAPQLAQPQGFAQLPVHDADGEVLDDDDDVGPDSEPPPAPVRAAPPARQEAPRGPAPRKSGSGWPWDAKKQGDIEKGTPLEDIDDAAIDRLIAYCDKNATGQYGPKNIALGKVARAIRAERQNPSAPPDQDPHGGRTDDPGSY